MRCTLRFSVFGDRCERGRSGLGPWVEGASIYLNIPSIAGENPTPGYPGAILVNPLDVTPDNFSIQKMIDKATPQIQLAVAGGTPLHTVSALVLQLGAIGTAGRHLAVRQCVRQQPSYRAGLDRNRRLCGNNP